MNKSIDSIKAENTKSNREAMLNWMTENKPIVIMYNVPAAYREIFLNKLNEVYGYKSTDTKLVDTILGKLFMNLSDKIEKGGFMDEVKEVLDNL